MATQGGVRAAVAGELCTCGAPRDPDHPRRTRRPLGRHRLLRTRRRRRPRRRGVHLLRRHHRPRRLRPRRAGRRAPLPGLHHRRPPPRRALPALPATPSADPLPDAARRISTAIRPRHRPPTALRGPPARRAASRSSRPPGPTPHATYRLVMFDENDQDEEVETGDLEDVVFDIGWATRQALARDERNPGGRAPRHGPDRGRGHGAAAAGPPRRARRCAPTPSTGSTPPRSSTAPAATRPGSRPSPATGRCSSPAAWSAAPSSPTPRKTSTGPGTPDLPPPARDSARWSPALLRTPPASDDDGLDRRPPASGRRVFREGAVFTETGPVSRSSDGDRPGVRSVRRSPLHHAGAGCVWAPVSVAAEGDVGPEHWGSSVAARAAVHGGAVPSAAAVPAGGAVSAGTRRCRRCRNRPRARRCRCRRYRRHRRCRRSSGAGPVPARYRR